MRNLSVLLGTAIRRRLADLQRKCGCDELSACGAGLLAIGVGVVGELMIGARGGVKKLLSWLAGANLTRGAR
jgi:hypothetical protein